MAGPSRGLFAAMVATLLMVGTLPFSRPARVNAGTAVSLNEYGHIACQPEWRNILQPLHATSSGEKTSPVLPLKGNSYVEFVNGFVTFSFCEGRVAKKVRFYDKTYTLLTSLEFDQIISLKFSTSGQYAAFFDGRRLTVIDLITRARSHHPASIVFDLDEEGLPAYHDYGVQCVVYKDERRFISDIPLNILLFDGAPFVFTAKDAFRLEAQELKRIFSFEGRFFEARVIDDRLYFVEKVTLGDSFRFKLYEMGDESDIRVIDERTYWKTRNNLDTHEHIRAPVHYYETSFPSMVKNSYAQIQEWSSLYLHPGVDFFEDPYEPVYSVQDGVVEAILTTGDERYWRIAIGNFGEVLEGYLYAHLNQDSFPFGVGDTVSAGDVIGTLFPAWGFEPHCHFARIAPAYHIWNGDWWTVDNPLVDVTNMTDSIAPVIEYALGGERFAFRTRNGIYLDPLNLSGEIQIIAKCVDYAVSTAFESRINVWDLQFRLFAPGSPVVPVYEKYSFIQDIPLDTYFSNAYETLVLNTMYSRDQTCFSTNNSTTKDFYYILTNSNGDSAITAEDSLQIFDTRNFYNGPYLLEVLVQDCAGNATSASMAIFIDNDFPPYRQMDGSSSPRLILEKNHPNPFNPATTIAYVLPEAGQVVLDVFDLQGRKIITLVEDWQALGRHEVTFNGSTLPSGIYPYRLTAGDLTMIERMLLIK